MPCRAMIGLDVARCSRGTSGDHEAWPESISCRSGPGESFCGSCCAIVVRLGAGNVDWRWQIGARRAERAVKHSKWPRTERCLCAATARDSDPHW
eukprot:scaffold145_cov261-Pinguiococcus_pyrenoidosus.AAC.6